MTLLKSKLFWGIAIVLVVSGGLYVRNKNAHQGPYYDTQIVARGTVRQTVDVTGQVTPTDRLSLSFKSSALITKIDVKAGDHVKQGQVLATLDTRDLTFAIQRAQASLANTQATLYSRQAGETKESIEISAAALDQAKANLAKAKADLEISKISVQDEYHVAELALQNARTNYNNATASNNQVIVNGFQSLQTTLTGSLGTLQTALTNGDRIIGVDDTSANASYAYVLSFSDSAALAHAKQHYVEARTAYTDSRAQVRALTTVSTETQVRAAALALQLTLQKTQIFLDDLQRVLAATVTSSSLTPTELAAKRSQTDADRIAITTQLSTVNSAIQTITNAELTRDNNLDQLRNAMQSAETSLMIADHNRITKVKTAETAVILNQASVTSAQAALDQKKVGPRAVDLAPLRALVQDSQVAYAQAVDRLKDTQIVAPVDGIVAEIPAKVGEQATPGVSAMTLISDQGYTIEALIPEADITKVQVGQSVSLTLDAFGDDAPFAGTVILENPDQTKVQDAIYYKVQVAVTPIEGREIKPGMTANITILTAERKEALYITNRAVHDTDGKKTVRILKAGTPEEIAIELGIRGDEGRVEVVSGLEVGQEVITAELTAAEYATLEQEKAALTK